MRAMILRLGQVAGPARDDAKGQWNSREWLPSLVLSSRYTHKLPASLGGDILSSQDAKITLGVGRGGGIDWMPIDELAEALIESAIWFRKNDRKDFRTREASLVY